MPGDLPDREEEAIVEEVAPRSYNVSSSGCTLRQYRRNLVQLQENSNESETDRDANDVETNEGPSVRRSTRVSRPFERLDPSWS